MEIIHYHILTIIKKALQLLCTYMSFGAMRPPSSKQILLLSKSLLPMLVQQRASKMYPEGENIDTHININTKLKSVIEKPNLLS